MSISYKDAGVDIAEGNRAVELMKSAVKSTYIPGVVGELGLFSGGFSLKDYMNMQEPTLLAATDGVGTKLLVAQLMDVHDTVGIDLVAMCVNDLICQGAKPLFFLDYIATGKVVAEDISNIVTGIAEGCRQSGCALIGGETAEMPGLYGEKEYDLAGFAVGIVDKQRIISGTSIKVGDKVIGLASTGLHSNGYSLARKLFFSHLGLNVSDKLESGKTVGELLLEPTKIYVKTVLALLEKFDIKGIANITGGGLIENVPRILPDSLTASFDSKSYPMPEVFNHIQKMDVVSKDELYKSFNMGIGMTIVAEKADEIVDFINHQTDDKAYIIGEIVEGDRVCIA